jgi:hypothetical protein
LKRSVVCQNDTIPYFISETGERVTPGNSDIIENLSVEAFAALFTKQKDVALVVAESVGVYVLRNMPSSVAPGVWQERMTQFHEGFTLLKTTVTKGVDLGLKFVAVLSILEAAIEEP